MRFTAALILLAALTLPLAADAVEEVRQAEIAFAKAFADRDKERFFSFVAEDAVFMNAVATQRGRKQVIERWSRFFEGGAAAPFSWGPERVEITGDGTIGFSMGPVYDAKGGHAGYYSSIWRKGSDGAWKVVIDGPGNPPAPLPELAAPAEEGFVTAEDGAKLFYRKVGSGPVTMIVPLDFVLHDSMRQFADIATVVTYDLRNRGRSGRLETLDSVGIEQDVRDMEAVRAHLKIEKFVPVGFSYLGKMVVMYAAAHPDRVRRVIQLGPLANERLETPPPGDFGAPAAALENLNRLREGGAMEKTPREFCLAQWEVLRYFMVGNPARGGNLEIDAMCALENEWPVNVNRMFERLLARPVVMTGEELKRVTMPVLTIHGTKDRNAPYAGGKAWAAALPDARLLTIPDAAHAMWVDDPATTFGAIRHFLRGEWPLGSQRAP